jgi:hypothetical protein
MAAHDGLFSHLKPNTNLGTNKCYLHSYQNWMKDLDERFPQNKHSLLIIWQKLHSNSSLEIDGYG